MLFTFSIVSPVFAKGITPCSEDRYATKRIKEIEKQRASSIRLENTQGQEVGSLFLGANKKPVDMILCGTLVNLFYINGDLKSWIPEAYEYKQIATVGSATISQDEAIMSAISYTDDEMSDVDYQNKIKVYFQYINLSDSSFESGQFFITIKQELIL